MHRFCSNVRAYVVWIQAPENWGGGEMYNLTDHKITQPSISIRRRVEVIVACE